MSSPTRQSADTTNAPTWTHQVHHAARETGSSPSVAAGPLLAGLPIAEEDLAQYTSSVSLARMLYGGDLAEWVPRVHPMVTIERQADGPVSFPDAGAPTSRCVTVVRAPMGSGKTTALLRWLKEAIHSPDTSVLVVSCRRSFTQTLAARFAASGLEEFVTYFSSTNYIMDDRPFHRLIVQVESLHRVGPNLLNNYDVLVLDEVMSTLGQLYSPTMQQLCRVDALLMRLLRACPRIIAMDATANAQLVDFLCGLRGEKNVHVVVGEYAMPGFSERRCLFLQRLGPEVLQEALREEGGGAAEPPAARTGTFFGELEARLAAGNNVCLFSSTVSFAEIAARFCRRFTDRVLLLHSLTPPGDVTTWGEYRVVIYTTVVTVGLSFDPVHFDSMFAYVKPMNYGPDMVSVYQSLGRVRTLRLGELLVYMDGAGARSEPVFTPMLLNHVVGARGRWPAQFSQVTGLLCRRFKGRCDASARGETAAARSSRVYARFRYKHYFERCTLACLADSLNILHTLLTLNCVRARFWGHGEVPSPRDFCRFLRGAHLDALRAQRLLRELRAGDTNVSLQAQAADTEEVGFFVEKYLRPDVSPAEIVALMRGLNGPVGRTRFVHLVLLEACLRVPTAMHSSAVFRRLYDHYATGVIPTVGPAGDIEVVALQPTLNVTPVWELFRLCGGLAQRLRWDSASGGSEGNFSAPDVLALMRPHYERYLQLLFEVGHCNVTDGSLLSEEAVRRVTDALSGRPARGAIGEADHALMLFRILWGELFGVQTVKSTHTFPGVGRVKNLTKDAIVGLLDAHHIDRSACRTHRQLYALLMAHKRDFAEARFRLRAPAWGRCLRARCAGAPPTPDLVLEAALSELPAEAWPMTQGALDFTTI
ncbi:DNA replication origin-binding helicase [Macacine alphaherpesvirus 1]|uniref:Replication origin-binding protein n=2 Tax=Cercopithecine herpesvirus 1 TaxID=10325 RepID=Q806C0_CHV1|nr:DNA replication origin-binding helicase [Macacine alphaherpesvirus 1]AAP41427.1 Ori binding protein [Macacine alphaherpesvirus 1]ARS01870.1 DNA replication origin-binding helicase [Macacine alphaherpesvirus 1]ARS01945.1 DNA replication origin-binding helicase [Macacine alphaherpesvirus 1]ARS02394.1 DNA replication origin-binding helicase [Macacine alphaherpesvirus 1]ARS02603.1 DNA replication origin-binding helicase [Macacine alphaherpesvirus 1]